jgi:Protein of unknown function (DUF3140)
MLACALAGWGRARLPSAGSGGVCRARRSGYVPGMSSSDKDTAEVLEEFHDAVNMTPRELEQWLGTEESASVGWTGDARKDGPGGGESKGHESGRHIVRLLRTKRSELGEQDYAEMRRVVGYVHRHLAQQPTKEDIGTSRWRYSLMNWGHDPLKRT